MARILVVDDHAHVRGAVRRVLTRHGHQVWDVSDGGEALRLLAILPFDLIVTDVYMSGMDGMELLSRAKAQGYRQPVVVMSGGGFVPREDLLRMARACGAFATVVKPFSPSQLRDTVESVLAPAVA